MARYRVTMRKVLRTGEILTEDIVIEHPESLVFDDIDNDWNLWTNVSGQLITLASSEYNHPIHPDDQDPPEDIWLPNDFWNLDRDDRFMRYMVDDPEERRLL